MIESEAQKRCEQEGGEKCVVESIKKMRCGQGENRRKEGEAELRVSRGGSDKGGADKSRGERRSQEGTS